MDGILSRGRLLERCRVRSTGRGGRDQRWKHGGEFHVGVHHIGDDYVWDDDIWDDDIWDEATGFHDIRHHAVRD